VSAATCEVHGAGAFTGGRDVTRTAGCQGGGEGGSGGCGGTGQPASATRPEVVGTVAVVGAGGAVGCARRPLGRGEASAGCRRREGAEMATRPEPFEALGRVEPDAGAGVATAATAMPTSTTDKATHERVIRPDKSTVHCRGPEGSKYCDRVLAASGSGCIALRQRSDRWKSGSAAAPGMAGLDLILAALAAGDGGNMGRQRQ